MDVTKSNFKELLPDILEAIDSSSFLAIDGEFTGLCNGRNVTAFDSPKQYYSKIRSGALDFLFVQFGLSIFKQVKGNERYENKTYVFYLFPQPLNRDMPDCRFLCQASSLTFLAENGFNFNKLIREGIPYLKQSDEDSLRETMNKSRYRAGNSTSSNNSSVYVPWQYEPIVKDAMHKIRELLLPSSTKKVIPIVKSTSFVRKLIVQKVREEFNDKRIVLEIKNGILIAKKISSEILNKEKPEKLDPKEEVIQEAVGFATIIRHLANSGKLIVGHNCLLDICHLVHRFIEPLPEDYLEFKEMVHCLFPKVLDTKYLVTEYPINKFITASYLPAVVEAIMKHPFQIPKIDCEENCSYDLQSRKFHDAGYDAYVTGLSFISVLRYLEKGNSTNAPAQAPVLQTYLNKLFLMKIPDVYIYLEGQDPIPMRDHVFHVTMPKSWTTQNLLELFSPFGPVHVNWMTDTTAWVSLLCKEFVPRATQDLVNGSTIKCPDVIVRGYAKYSDSIGSAAMSPRPNKRKSASSVATTHNTKTASVLSVGGEGDRISKKRKSSTEEHSIETILEEVENNGSGGSLVAKESSSCSNSSSDTESNSSSGD